MSEVFPTQEFDLTEDGVTDTVVVDTNADAVPDVVAFDLDQDSVPETVIVDSDADSVPDLAFDLDVDPSAAAAVPEVAEEPLEGADTEFDLVADAPVDDDGIPTGEAPEGERDLSEDSLTTAPDEVTNEDVENAAQDLNHMNLMNTYMQSQGVI